MPLLSLLSEYLRFLVEWPLWQSFVSLYEVQSTNTASVPAHCLEIIPSLLADPIALMIKYTLLAPLRMDIGKHSLSTVMFRKPNTTNTEMKISVFPLFFLVYFTCIVKVMYNLLYFQVIVKLCSSLTEAECNQIISKYGTEEFSGFNNLGSAMAYVLKVTNKCQQFRNDPSFATSTNNLSATFASTSTSSQPEINLNLIEQQLQKLCLPFLRIAALLRHHLYEQHLPEIKVPQMEFVCLVYFLELVTVDINWDSFDAAKALCFVPGHEQKLPELWCVQLMSQHRGLIFEEIANKEMATLVNDQHALWEQPRLLRLPREYEKLFTVSS